VKEAKRDYIKRKNQQPVKKNYQRVVSQGPRQKFILFGEERSIFLLVSFVCFTENKGNLNFESV